MHFWNNFWKTLFFSSFPLEFWLHALDHMHTRDIGPTCTRMHTRKGVSTQQTNPSVLENERPTREMADKFNEMEEASCIQYKMAAFENDSLRKKVAIGQKG